MATQAIQYKHTKIELKYENNKLIKIGLPHKKSFDEQLEKVTTKISKQWKLSDGYQLSINDISFEPNDSQKFEELLSQHQQLITIHIVTKHVKAQKQTQNNFKLKIKYKNDMINYPLPSDLNEWDDNTYNEIRTEISKIFKIKNEEDAFQICRDDIDDPDGEKIDVDDIDDIKDQFEESESNQFELILYVITTGDELEQDLEDEKEQKIELYKHKKITITIKYKNSKVQVNISDEENSGQENLDIINNKIQKKKAWALNTNYKLSINDNQIELNDTETFHQLLCDTEPPATIDVIEIKTSEITQESQLMNNELISEIKNAIWQSHQILYGKIYAKEIKYFDKTRIKLKMFDIVTECLNILRPKHVDQYNNLSYGITGKIQFWQKYAHLCLIVQNVRDCIELRIAIKKELYDTEEFTDDLIVQQYTKLREIISKYHSLNQTDDVSKFENLITLCSNIKVAIPPNMMPVDPNAQQDVDESKIAKQQRGTSASINDGNNINKNVNMVRIYLLSSCDTSIMSVRIPPWSQKWFNMFDVSRANTHLWFIDWPHPANAFDVHTYSVPINFRCVTQAGMIPIQPKNGVRKSMKAFYCIQDNRTQLMKLYHQLAPDSWHGQTEQKKAGVGIVNQLLREIKDFLTFNRSFLILQDLKHVLNPSHVDKIMVTKAKKDLMSQHKIIFVYRLLFFKILMPYEANIQLFYHIMCTIAKETTNAA
eukprot:238866_1